MEGYMSAFLAKKCPTRLKIAYPDWKGKRSGKDAPVRWLESVDKIEELLRGIPARFATTQQKEVRSYFDHLDTVAAQIETIMATMGTGKTAFHVSIVCLFANVGWDLDVLRGIIFPGTEDPENVGVDVDLVQLMHRHIVFRDFLRLTGFSSIKSAGKICTIRKLDGTEVYNLHREDIPERYEDYSPEKQEYIEHDVDIMLESLNILLSQKPYQIIKTLSELPMTKTGFGRFHLQFDPWVQNYDKSRTKKLPYRQFLTIFRWLASRPFLALFIRAYKGGYCGPNPICQYKMLRDVVCFDARSMYPHKMLFFNMLQCTKFSNLLFSNRKFSEIPEGEETENEKKIKYRIDNVKEYFQNELDEDGFFTTRPDDPSFGITPWLALVTLRIKGVRRKGDIAMPPFLSRHKIEGPIYDIGSRTIYGRNVEHINGKIMRADEIEMYLTSVDLFLCHLCYDCEVLACTDMLTMSWQPMLYPQKREVVAAYRDKMRCKDIFDKDKVDYGKADHDDYWSDNGINPETIHAMSPDEYRKFWKEWYGITKAAVNSQYGMTVEKPLHVETKITHDEFGLPHVEEAESVSELFARLIENPDIAPRQVKTSDFCAGSSITMWARWQLITMVYILWLKGINTYYCDTDSIFTDNVPLAFELIEVYNDLLHQAYGETDISADGEKVQASELEYIGDFELDKECELFVTLGAKNYCRYSKKGGIQITVAGLRSQGIEDAMNDLIKGGMSPVDAMRYFRPNLFIHPNMVHKLLKNTSGCHYDEENGDWCGPVLEECGFTVINMNSVYHKNNAYYVGQWQGKIPGYYLGKYQTPLLLTAERGFTKIVTDEDRNCIYETVVSIEENNPIEGGLVHMEVDANA